MRHKNDIALAATTAISKRGQVFGLLDESNMSLDSLNFLIGLFMGFTVTVNCLFTECFGEPHFVRFQT